MGRGVLDPERGYLNKWQMYLALQGENIGPCRLPVTEELSRCSLRSMLERYQQVYVKPVDTYGGHLVSTISLSSDGFEWTAQGAKTQRYPTFQHLADDVFTVYQTYTCIVQQAAPLLRFESKPFDIRILMQRDLEDHWLFSGGVARVGGEGAVVSNVEVSGGEVWPVDGVIAKVLAKPVDVMYRHLERVGACVCTLLDGYRDFEEAGIDIGVADGGELWLIEVNTDDAMGGPSHQLFAQLEDKRQFQDIEERLIARRMSVVSLLFGSLAEDAYSDT